MFATKNTYSGQRASVGRIVCVKFGSEIAAGVIVAIGTQGHPVIRSMSDFPNGRDSAFNHGEENLPHAEVRDESGIETAPERCWFWPPRV